MFIASTSSGILPTACAASVWKKAFFSRQILPISASGWMTPISLFTAMTETTTVLSVTAARSASRSIRPFFCTGRYVTSKPCCSRWRQVSSTHLCSVTVVTMWFLRSL